MAMDDFDNFPVYCIVFGTVAKQPVVKTGESCGELGMEPQGNNTMVTPPRKISQLEKTSIGTEIHKVFCEERAEW